VSTPVTVAAFDLDGTLTEGGSVGRWLRYVAGLRPFLSAGLSLTPALTLGAVASGRRADSAKEQLFRKTLSGRNADDVLRLSEEFGRDHVAEEIRPAVLERLRWHQAQGHRTVVVSASPEMYVSVIARQLGADAAIGTRLAVDPLGRLTGGYLGRNCRGEEKIRRLREWIDGQHFDREPELFAYGNSRGDRRLLRAATYPFDVGKLGRFGALRNFPRLSSVELPIEEQ
jgi:HAD superfamily hydrolase (TIGR01490 family)